MAQGYFLFLQGRGFVREIHPLFREVRFIPMSKDAYIWPTEADALEAMATCEAIGYSGNWFVYARTNVSSN